MRASRRTILGVEIAAEEIRLVEVRGGTTPQVVRMGAVPLPEDALEGDRIVLIDAVANLIRGLLNRLNCQSRTAVFGIGLQSITTRVIQIPPVPFSEMRVVIEGELAHFHILRTGLGAFDFFPLGAAPGSDGLHSILVMAVEQRIARSYRQVAEKAGLELLALAPISAALYRTAFPALQSGHEMMCLMVTPARCELAIVSRGDIRLYRRLEMGSDDLLSGRAAQNPIPASPVDLAGSDGALTPIPERISPPQFPDASHSVGGSESHPPVEHHSYHARTADPTNRIWALADEIQRSLDYYRREYPASEPVVRLLLATNDPEASILDTWLRQQLQMDVRVIEMPIRSDATIAPDTLPTAARSLRFVGAYGLALQPLTPEWRQCPQFNLTPNEPAALRRADRDRLALLVVSGVIILITGIAAGRVFAHLAEQESANLGVSRALLENRHQTLMERDVQIAQEQALQSIARSDNLPVGTLLGIIAAQLPDGVSLLSVDIQHNGHVVIEGEARTGAAFDSFYGKLQVCPQFVTTRYTQISTEEVNKITRFRIETSVHGTQDAITRSRS